MAVRFGFLADRVEHYTTTMHEICDVLRDRGDSDAVYLVQILARRGAALTCYLRNNDAAAMWNDVREAARGRTWLLAGAGFVTGLAVARTVRTTASR